VAAEDEAEWGGTQMRAVGADGSPLEILGHEDGTGWSVWAQDDSGRFWDMKGAGRSDIPGPEGQAAAAFTEGRDRGWFS
jgi:hypothetical protein